MDALWWTNYDEKVHQHRNSRPGTNSGFGPEEPRTKCSSCTVVQVVERVHVIVQEALGR